MVFSESLDLDLIVDRSWFVERFAGHDLFVIDAGRALAHETVVADRALVHEMVVAGRVLAHEMVVAGFVLVHVAVAVGGLVPWISCVVVLETYGHVLAIEIFRCLHNFVEGVQCLPYELVPNFEAGGLSLLFLHPIRPLLLRLPILARLFCLFVVRNPILVLFRHPHVVCPFSFAAGAAVQRNSSRPRDVF